VAPPEEDEEEEEDDEGKAGGEQGEGAGGEKRKIERDGNDKVKSKVEGRGMKENENGVDRDTLNAERVLKADDAGDDIEQQLPKEEEGEDEPLEIAKKIFKNPKGIPELTANYLFQTAAPKSKVEIKGFCVSSLFVFWYIASSSVMFALLFWHFYTASCTLVSSVVDLGQPSDVYQNLFSTGDNHFCTSKFVTDLDCGYRYVFECMLTGFTPDNFASHFLCPPTNMKSAFTENLTEVEVTLEQLNHQGNRYYSTYDGQKYGLLDWEAYSANVEFPPFCGQDVGSTPNYTFLGFDGNCLTYPNRLSNLPYPISINYASPTASLTYVTCDPLSSTLATAGQCKLYLYYF